MLSVLLLSLLFFIQDTFARQPTCPNGQQPKVDKTGNIVQCLPGSPQNAICGMDHTCFFSGLNYMCCPSNEPSPENQPSCANPMLTVLDSHGLPLKCSPRTRLCPQTSMFCSDVGLAFICCEAIPTIVSGTKTSTMVTKTSILKKIKKTRTALLPEETLDCPAKSIGLLHQDGSRIICNSRKKCPGKNTFCHGPYKRSICCERYEYAGSILDNKEAPRATPSVPGSSFIKNQNHLRSNNISVSLKRPGGTMKKVDRTTLEIDNIVDSAGWIHSNEMINLNKINKINSAESQPRPQRPESLPNLVIQAEGNSLSTNIKPSSKDSTLTIIKEEHLIKNGSKTPLLPSAKQLETTTTTKTTTTTTTTTATTPPTTTTTTMTTAKITMEASNVRSKAQGTRINDLSTDIFSPNELSKTPPSELFTSQDKRSMAQQFLVYQIRNGWPYDDRFYRSDIDAFTPEQRRDMTHLHFFDN